MSTAPMGMLVGPWLVQERIGGGGQASVHRGRHSAGGGPVAVKLLHPALWDDPAFRRRFARERRALGALAHPHIVPLLDAGEGCAGGYLVMPLARGGTLADLARRPLAPDEAVAVLAAVADALDAAHAAGLLHRDVTPANVLIDRDGPWLADFGLARPVDATTATGDGLLLGTAGFLAPEVIDGAPATPASDRYALAAVAFEALTGHAPFAADGVPGLLYAHLHGAPRRPSSLRAELPPALDAALVSGLAKDPKRRPPSARALVDSLSRALAESPLPTAATRPLPRPRRRRVVLAPVALLAAGIVAAGGATAATLALTRQAERAPAAAAPPPAAATVPGVDGVPVPSAPARPSDLPGLPGARDAVAADVGGLRVVALAGGWTRLSAARAALEQRGHRARLLDDGDGRPLGLLAWRPDDLAGAEPVWALLALAEPAGPRAVLVRGPRAADPAAHAASLATAAAGRILPAPG